MRRVVRENNLRSPTLRELQRLRDDAIGRLGSSVYVGQLALLAAIAGEVREGWIPSRFMWDVVEPALNGDLHRRTGMRRTLAGRMFPRSALPDVAYRIRGEWFGPDLEPIEMRSHLDRYHDTERFVLKEEGSRQAEGSTALDRTKLIHPASRRGPDAVLQRYLEQHPVLTELSPHGVAPVRVLTTSGPGGVRAIAFMLRVGIADDVIIPGNSAIRLVMDADGAIHPVGSDPRFRLHRSHPATGLVFDGSSVPALARTTDLCRSLHAAVPHLGLIGWDMGIDREGRPWLLESNTQHPGVIYNEVLEGPKFVAERWELLRTNGVTTRAPRHEGPLVR